MLNVLMVYVAILIDCAETAVFLPANADGQALYTKSE